jgi:hypothetical protein
MTILVLRSVVALLALFISILMAGPVVDRVNALFRKSASVAVTEILVILVSWLALLILLRVF